MYLKYRMGVIGIGELMSRCAEIWETESVLLAELQQVISVTTLTFSVECFGCREGPRPAHSS